MATPTPQPQVTVSATAHGHALPDSFVITAQVSAEAGDAAKAARTLVERYSRLEAAVAHLPPSLQIVHGSISNWPADPKRNTWQSVRPMTLTGTDLALVGQVANSVAAVPDVALDGPHWQLGPDAPIHGELQGHAVLEARARAERYAAALGGALGRLVHLTDGNGGHRYAAAASMRGGLLQGGGPPDMASLDLTPQPLEVSTSVTVTWYLVLPD
jgi:uncharacterized protein YggE